MDLSLQVGAVWDIECADWDKFLCGALWTPADGMRVTRDASELARWIMALPSDTHTWAHSGGRYDVLWWLEQRMRDHAKLPDATVYLSGGSASGVRVTGGPWLRDSARLIPMSLKKAGAWVGEHGKGDLALPCICDTACGGYCSLRVDMPTEYWDLTIKYLVRDVEVLRDLLTKLFTFATKNYIELRGTVGGTAWATAQAWCGVPDADLTWTQYRTARQGYYGGRVEVARTEHAQVYRYDRRGAYLASLLEPLPVGRCSVYRNRHAGEAWDEHLPGVYHVDLSIPESFAPPLPVRTGERLAYPWGDISGEWTHLEIKHALAQGATLTKIRSAVVWEREEAVLADYAKEIGRLRDVADAPDGQGKACSVWLKFLGNSLTGKLGQDPDWPMIKLGDYADDPRYEPVGASPWVWQRTLARMASCAYPHWAATLTSRARIDLHQQILHAGDAWCYSDTDSVFATKPLTRNVGDELGQWQYEGTGDNWRALAPKVYAYDAEKRVRHAKGVPNAEDPDTWERYAHGETVRSNRGVAPLLTAVRGGPLFARRSVSRTLRPRDGWVGARILDPGSHVTRAPNMRDLIDLAP